jgi:hypothetical protein
MANIAQEYAERVTIVLVEGITASVKHNDEAGAKKLDEILRTVERLFDLRPQRW